MGNSSTHDDVEIDLIEEEIPDLKGENCDKDLVMDCPDYTTDAVGSESFIINARTSIPLEDLRLLENYLDYYEKVSLVFLLYDDVKVAIQNLLLIKAGSEKSVLEDWAKCSYPNWQNKLLESLCIVQNYAILKQLGYSKSEMQIRFLPDSPHVVLAINHVNKLLYMFCESLNSDTTKKFVSYLQTDYQDRFGKGFEEFNSEPLEFLFLHLISENYISSTHLSPILRVLKQLDLNKFYELLIGKCKNEEGELYLPTKINKHLQNQEVLIQKSENKQTEHNFCVDQNAGEHRTFSLESNLTQRSSISVSPEGASFELNQKKSRSNHSYIVNKSKPGICLIINQEYFYTESDESLQNLLPPGNEKLDNRKGTGKDKEILEETFKSFGYKVYVEDNKTHKEIVQAVKNAVQKVTIDHSSLFICILSHGLEGKIYGVNSIPVDIKTIKDTMCNYNLKNMKDKPKILILQACRGLKCQEVVKEDEVDEIHEDDLLSTDGPREIIKYADMFIFSATVPGFGAIRDKKNGTWFIQVFCQKLKEVHNQYHFEEICNLVIQDVLHRRWGCKVMVPQKESTLSKFFYLPALKED